MKFAMKRVLGLVLGATALTGFASTASAQQTYVVTSYEYETLAGVESQGLTFGLSGRYLSGFAYDIELFSADTAGVATAGVSAELGYRIGGIAGPVALYEYVSFAGLAADQLLLGVEGGTDLSGTDIFAKALFDTNDLDVYRLEVGATHAINEDVALNGAVTRYENVVVEDVTMLEIGARYRVIGNMHADFGASYGRTDSGVEMAGLRLGLGFDF